MLDSDRGTRQQQVRSEREKENFGRPTPPRRSGQPRKVPTTVVWLVLFLCFLLPALVIANS